MTPPTHIIHIAFFEEGTETLVGAVDHALPPNVGDTVWLDAKRTTSGGTSPCPTSSSWRLTSD